MKAIIRVALGLLVLTGVVSTIVFGGNHRAEAQQTDPVSQEHTIEVHAPSDDILGAAASGDAIVNTTGPYTLGAVDVIATSAYDSGGAALTHTEGWAVDIRTTGSVPVVPCHMLTTHICRYQESDVQIATIERPDVAAYTGLGPWHGYNISAWFQYGWLMCPASLQDGTLLGKCITAGYPGSVVLPPTDATPIAL